MRQHRDFELVAKIIPTDAPYDYKRIGLVCRVRQHRDFELVAKIIPTDAPYDYKRIGLGAFALATTMPIALSTLLIYLCKS